MLKLFNTLWRSAAKQTNKIQRKQAKKLIQQLVPKSKPLKLSPASKTALKPRQRSPMIAPNASWRRLRFIATKVNLSLEVVPGSYLDYWLYQPSIMREGAVPLIVMLHGCAQTAVEFAEGTRMNQLGESKGFGVLYPQQTVRLNANRCWHWYKKPVQHGKGEAAMIAELINHVVSQNGFDSSRIYLAGLSAGAAMAQIVALQYPEMIAAVGLHSSPVNGAAHNAATAFAVMQGGSSHTKIGSDAVFSAAAKSLKMPAILIQGLDDTVVRPVNLPGLETQFCQINRLNAAQRQPISRHAAGKTARSAHAFDTVDYKLGKRTLLRVCQIFDLQHAWSGGDAAYRFNERKGPDASRMLWNFFARHRRQSVPELRAPADLH